MKRLLMTAAIAVFSFTACDIGSSVDGQQSKATETLVAEANRQVGMPLITNFTQRKLAKTILELCDQDGLSTYTYIVNMHGEARFLCESIGYGLPFSVQFTNPERCHSHTHGGDHTLPQPDPNGLFMPASSSATWVIVATENGPRPLYVESEILVLPYKMEDVPNVWDAR